jgi:hypothetical protein
MGSSGRGWVWVTASPIARVNAMHSVLIMIAKSTIKERSIETGNFRRSMLLVMSRNRAFAGLLRKFEDRSDDFFGSYWRSNPCLHLLLTSQEVECQPAISAAGYFWLTTYRRHPRSPLGGLLGANQDHP